jgi:hypothetical protein
MRSLLPRIVRFRLTRLASVLLALLTGCVVLAIVGSGGAQTAGFVGAIVTALLLLGGGQTGQAGSGWG